MGDYHGRPSFAVDCLVDSLVQIIPVMAIHLKSVPSKGTPFICQRFKRKNFVGCSVDLQFIIVTDAYNIIHFVVGGKHGRFPYLSLITFAISYYAEDIVAFVVKSYQQDPFQRSKFRRLVGWWFKDQLYQFGMNVIGRHVLPTRMILAELWGGIVGLLGEYPRSLRRIEQIKKQFASDVALPFQQQFGCRQDDRVMLQK